MFKLNFLAEIEGQTTFYILCMSSGIQKYIQLSNITLLSRSRQFNDLQILALGTSMKILQHVYGGHPFSY